MEGSRVRSLVTRVILVVTIVLLVFEVKCTQGSSVRSPRLIKELLLSNKESCMAKIICGVDVASNPSKASSTKNDFAFAVKSFFDVLESDSDPPPQPKSSNSSDIAQSSEEEEEEEDIQSSHKDGIDTLFDKSFEDLVAGSIFSRRASKDPQCIHRVARQGTPSRMCPFSVDQLQEFVSGRKLTTTTTTTTTSTTTAPMNIYGEILLDPEAQLEKVDPLYTMSPKDPSNVQFTATKGKKKTNRPSNGGDFQGFGFNKDPYYGYYLNNGYTTTPRTTTSTTTTARTTRSTTTTEKSSAEDDEEDDEESEEEDEDIQRPPYPYKNLEVESKVKDARVPDIQLLKIGNKPHLIFPMTIVGPPRPPPPPLPPKTAPKTTTQKPSDDEEEDEEEDDDDDGSRFERRSVLLDTLFRRDVNATNPPTQKKKTPSFLSKLWRKPITTTTTTTTTTPRPPLVSNSSLLYHILSPHGMRTLSSITSLFYGGGSDHPHQEEEGPPPPPPPPKKKKRRPPPPPPKRNKKRAPPQKDIKEREKSDEEQDDGDDSGSDSSEEEKSTKKPSKVNSTLVVLKPVSPLPPLLLPPKVVAVPIFVEGREHWESLSDLREDDDDESQEIRRRPSISTEGPKKESLQSSQQFDLGQPFTQEEGSSSNDEEDSSKSDEEVLRRPPPLLKGIRYPPPGYLLEPID